MRILLASAAVGAMATLSSCSLGSSEPESSASEAPAGEGTAAVSPAPAEAPSVTPVTNFDLLYVRSQAPNCTAVWSPGATLPEDYEWCVGEDGQPVSGPRIGSCEVVTHENQFYGVPGFQIRAAMGEITQDPGYLEELVSCKRTPVPASARRG